MITLKAPAKINWSLYVLDKRADGYHNILSLMQRVALYDTITLEPSSALYLQSDMQVPPEQNLVFRAAEALRKAAGTDKGALITLKKEIPSGAGLGGGSSDAAYTLAGLNKMWDLGLDFESLSDIGASLGSDVPFFLKSSAAVAKGRGEQLVPEQVASGLNMLIVKPGASISTARAYQAVSDSRKAGCGCSDLTNQEEKLNNIKLIIRAINAGQITLLGALLHNDFERVAIDMHPVIGEIREKLFDAGAAAVLLSGSGSAVFGVYSTAADAGAASGLFSSFWSRVVVTL
jgi:4-diphosphocytidyl-2-C-methyl-D-erythritol kinase